MPELEECLDRYQQLGIVDVLSWYLPRTLLHSNVSFVYSIFRPNDRMSFLLS